MKLRLVPIFGLDPELLHYQILRLQLLGYPIYQNPGGTYYFILTATQAYPWGQRPTICFETEQLPATWQPVPLRLAFLTAENPTEPKE